MCQYSLEGYPNRDAKQNETLELRAFGGGHAGFFGTTTRSKRKLVCVKPGMALTLDRVVFNNAPRLYEAYTDRFRAALAWEGKTDVVVKMASWFGCDSDSDALEFPDGQRMHLGFFAMGTKALVGERLPQKATEPRDLDKAMGLDQIRADVPKEKTPIEAW